MTLLTRVVARSFRTLFARCVSGRPRGPAPAVVVQVRDGIRTVASTTPDGVTLTHTTPAPKEPDFVVVLPASVVEQVEGGTDELVELDRSTKLRGVVRWHGGAKLRTLPVELILPGKPHELPALPTVTGVSAKLLVAVHECGRAVPTLWPSATRERHGRASGAGWCFSPRPMLNTEHSYRRTES